MTSPIFNPREVVSVPVDGDTQKAISSDYAFDHAADLDAHTKNIYELIRTGAYFTNFQGVSYSQALTADRLFAVPLIVVRDMTVDRIAVEVTAGGGGTPNVRLGIYNNGTNVAPGTLKLDAGVVDTTAIGVVAVIISQALTKGLYWLAGIAQGTPSLRAQNYTYKSDSILGLTAVSFDEANQAWYYSGAYGALPDPFPVPTGMAVTQGIIIAVRILTLD